MDLGDLETNGNAKETECLESHAETETGLDSDRIHISPVPKFFGFKQFKKFLKKHLPGIDLRKIRQMKFDAYVSFNSSEDAQTAISKLNGLEVRKVVLSAKLAQTEKRKVRIASTLPIKHKTAKESVTKFADLSYREQLLQKEKTSHRYTRPSPKVRAYRNKCEFTIGRTQEGEMCVGFVGGRFSQNEHHVIPIDGLDNITDSMKRIVEAVTKFVQDSGLPAFDETTRCGVWKMLTVREFGADVMLILTVNPLENLEEEKKLKEGFCTSRSTFLDDGFRVTSIYWHSVANCSDKVDYEHIGGAPYIYETLLDCRFRVSPSAFFQTNSQAASVLYTTIGESCGLSLCNDSRCSETVEISTKRAKLDVSCANLSFQDTTPDINLKSCGSEDCGQTPTVILDICCGTGTVGQFIVKEFKKRKRVYCIGVDIVDSAIADAKENAKVNGIRDMCCYLAGKAEDVFQSLRFNVPPEFDLQKSDIVGVLDPPRCGVHEKVILGCRMMETLRHLVFVSCDPAAAMKNIVDLCRPTSKKYAGQPFMLSTIQPVDMFPQTPHIEWVVTLER
ncbi:unnamed protein product [Angiostrongylus costaricensis]|uniref:tRNA (uracil(54)-C(5))-methyltransferase n=1 Tax=Angiostrongylus costaricensis TaxID=334426 RepID=A0A158PM03_ANGCS|nr:unnamed protein product [Angiostrongylus costaricensis]